MTCGNLSHNLSLTIELETSDEKVFTPHVQSGTPKDVNTDKSETKGNNNSNTKPENLSETMFHVNKVTLQMLKYFNQVRSKKDKWCLMLRCQKWFTVIIL